MGLPPTGPPACCLGLPPMLLSNSGPAGCRGLEAVCTVVVCFACCCPCTWPLAFLSPRPAASASGKGSLPSLT